MNEKKTRVDLEISSAKETLLCTTVPWRPQWQETQQNTKGNTVQIIQQIPEDKC